VFKSAVCVSPELWQLPEGWEEDCIQQHFEVSKKLSKNILLA
jgi:hypothetical protein